MLLSSRKMLQTAAILHILLAGRTMHNSHAQLHNTSRSHHRKLLGSHLSKQPIRNSSSILPASPSPGYTWPLNLIIRRRHIRRIEQLQKMCREHINQDMMSGGCIASHMPHPAANNQHLRQQV
jgi:hypothetical protein